MAPRSDGFLSGFPGCLSPLPSPYLLGVLGRPRPQEVGELSCSHTTSLKSRRPSCVCVGVCVCVCVCRWLAGWGSPGLNGGRGQSKGADAWFLSSSTLPAPHPIPADPQLTPHSGSPAWAGRPGGQAVVRLGRVTGDHVRGRAPPRLQ